MLHVNSKKWQCCISLSLISLNITFEFKKRLCPMSLHFDPSCRMSLSPMLHVEFKKCSCRPVEFNGQGPLYRKTQARKVWDPVLLSLMRARGRHCAV